MKKCSNCQRLLPETDFYKHKRHRDGLESECKDCHDKKTSKYYIEHRKERLKEFKKYRQENQEDLLVYDKKRYQRDKEKRNTLHTNWLKTKENRKKHHTYCKKWRDENGEKRKGYKEKYMRNYGYIPLFDNPFPEDIEIENHHINNILVIPIPKNIHKKTIRKQKDVHRKLCEPWIQKIYQLDIETLLTP